MKYSTLLKKLSLALALSLTFTACAPSTGGHGPMGTSSGGGGYGDESGNAVLDYASKELIKELNNASPEVLAALPPSMPKDMIVNLLQNIEVDKSKYRQRDGIDLIFDYDEKRGKIIATKYFFDKMAHLNLFTMMLSSMESMTSFDNELLSAIEGTKMKLLHEIAHIGGFGKSKDTDTNARAVALSTIISLKSNYLYCNIKLDRNKMKNKKWYPIRNTYDIFGELSSQDTPEQKADQYARNAHKFSFIIHRPTLRGLLIDSKNAATNLKFKIDRSRKLISPTRGSSFSEGNFIAWFNNKFSSSDSFMSLRGRSPFIHAHFNGYTNQEDESFEEDFGFDWQTATAKNGILTLKNTEAGLLNRQNISVLTTTSTVLNIDYTQPLEEGYVQGQKRTMFAGTLSYIEREGKLDKKTSKKLEEEQSRISAKKILINGTLGMNQLEKDFTATKNVKQTITYQESYPLECVELNNIVNYKDYLEK